MAAGICKRCGDPTGNPDGRQWYCETCRKARTREAARASEARHRLRRKPRKPCRHCGGEKPAGARARYCSDACRKAVAEAKREAKRVYDAQRWPLVRDAELAAQRARRQVDDAFRLASIIRAREWSRAHPEEAAAIRRRSVLNYRARKAQAFVEAVDPAVVYVRDRGICGICGDAVARDGFHVDHVVPLARGGEHSYRNVQLAHPRCNVQKGARLLAPASTSLEV